MGQAKQRGTFEQRKAAATKIKKQPNRTSESVYSKIIKRVFGL